MTPTVFTFTQNKYHLILQVVLPAPSRVFAREGDPRHECHCDLGQNCRSSCNWKGRP